MVRRVRALAFLLVAVCAASCAPGHAESPEVNGHRYFGSLAAPAGQVLRFNLGSEPELRDPGTMSGQPDGRFARIVFEGLTTSDPRTLEPRPAQAYRWETSADGLTYTFHLRPGLAWADGAALTSRDFLWSWLRVLAPATAARNASLFYAIRGAEDYNKGVETDASKVGLSAPDDSTFVVTLSRPTAYFLFLTTYYAFLPVPRAVVERWGIHWTLPEHLVGNGPFRWTHWRQNDRYEFVPSETYWDRKSVRLEKIVAFVVDDLSTSTNLYKSGAIDWNPSNYIPSQYLPYLKDYADFRRGKFQSTYFYSVNCTKRPFDDPWVRRALNLAIDRDAISRDLLKGSRDPWGRITPMGYPGYDGPQPVTFDPVKARACLARAGYPGGRGFPRFTILFNTSEDHRRIAEAIQAMWKRELGIDVQLQNQEWGSYMQATTTLHYDVARRSWIGDYLDPNSFLQLLVTGDGNNRSGFSNARYDALMREASNTLDPAKRFSVMARAESLAIDQAPYLPIYHYSVSELVKPWVKGIYPTALDVHPLKDVWIDHDWREHEPLAGEGARR
jgi:ABC-type oligopeptide transport system substrate-binding subunit